MSRPALSGSVTEAVLAHQSSDVIMMALHFLVGLQWARESENEWNVQYVCYVGYPEPAITLQSTSQWGSALKCILLLFIVYLLFTTSRGVRYSCVTILSFSGAHHCCAIFLQHHE